MNKTVLIIIGVSVLIIVALLVFSGKSEAAPVDTTIQDLGKVLNQGGNKKKDCRKTCQLVCKQRGWFFKGRSKCKKACKSDCGRGVDVTQKTY